MPSLGIRSRLLLLVGAPIFFVAALLTALFALERIEQARHEQQRRLAAIARHIAASAEYHIFVDNREALAWLLNSALQEADVFAAAIADREGRLLASTIGREKIPNLPDIPEIVTLEATKNNGPWRRMAIQPEELAPHNGDAFGAHPALAPLAPIGHVLIAIDQQPLRSEIERQVLKAVFISLFVLLLGLAGAYLLSRRFATLLIKIGQTVDAVGAGHLSARVAEAGEDELGRLARGINQMAARVEFNQAELYRRVEEATRALRAEKEAAEAAAAARSQFFAAASHDLRQPLQALALFALRLEHDAKRSALLPRIRQLNESIRALQTLLDALLDYSRLTSGAISAHLQPTRVDQILNALVQEFAPLAAEKGLALRQRVRHSTCTVLSDPALLHRILLNLVSNALRHTERGGVLLACRKKAGKVRIEVWDTGPGIPEEARMRIFEEFVQLANPERDPAKGLGLGLAIAKRTAELLGHRLELRSRPGRGSCFALELDAIAQADSHEPPLSSHPSARLILCSDGAHDREILPLLSGWGFDVASVRGLDHLVEWVHGAPDLLLIAVSDDLERIIALLNRYDALMGKETPTLILTPSPPPSALDLGGARRKIQAFPCRPARLRALIDYLILGR
ncbi:MAG: ATP-binding protein [Rhodocyclaceae bacterium]|nr:ATP-binding protein [Rhodocyclaceae bacterium]